MENDSPLLSSQYTLGRTGTLHLQVALGSEHLQWPRTEVSLQWKRKSQSSFNSNFLKDPVNRPWCLTASSRKKKTARDMWILQRLRCDVEIHQISRQKQFHSQSQHRLVEMWTPFSSKQNHALPELSLRVWFWVRTTTAHLALPCKVVLTRLWSLLPGGCPPPTSLPWIA